MVSCSWRLGETVLREAEGALASGARIIPANDSGPDARLKFRDLGLFKIKKQETAFDSKLFFIFHQPSFIIMTTPRSFFRSAALAATLLCLFSLAFSGTSDFADKGTACTTESVGNYDGGFITATPTIAAEMINAEHAAVANDESAWNSQTESGANEATSCTAGLANARTDQDDTGDDHANCKISGAAFARNTHAVFTVMSWKPTASSARTVHVWTATDGAAFSRNSWQQNCTAALLKDATFGAVSTNNFANGNSTSTCGIPGDTASVAFNQNSGGMHTMGDYNSGQGVSQADFSGADYDSGHATAMTSSTSGGASIAYKDSGSSANFWNAG